mgnify:CR=1 FL=1
MPIRLVTVGKVSAPWSAVCTEYAARLQRYDRLEIVEVPEFKEPQHTSETALKEHTRREGEGLLKRIRADEYVIALCIDGKQHGSEFFSNRLRALRVEGKSPCFVIGGSMGLSEEVLQRADERMSLSAMTFPHQMARAVLLEQLYRAFKIMGGERYHK